MSSSSKDELTGGDGEVAADLDDKKSGRGATAGTALARCRETRAIPRTRKQVRAEGIKVPNPQCTYSPENPPGRHILIVSMFNNIEWWNMYCECKRGRTSRNTFSIWTLVFV